MLGENLIIGIVGCGKQAPKHIAGIRQAAPDAKISVYDIDLEASRELALAQKVDYSESFEALVGQPGLQGLIVASPTPYHVDAVVAGLQAGASVFCEKPLCTTAEQAEAIRALEQRSRGFLQVGYVYRFVPAFQYAHDLLRDPAKPLGEAVLLTLRLGGRGSASIWKHRAASGGGAVSEMLVHMADLARWLLGDLTDVKVLDRQVLRPRRQIHGQAVDADAEDFVLAAAHAGGAHVVLQADLVTPAFSQHLELQGENGSLIASIDPAFPAYMHLIEARGAHAAGRTPLSLEPVNLFSAQMANFVANIHAGEANNCARVEDTLQLFGIMEAARG